MGHEEYTFLRFFNRNILFLRPRFEPRTSGATRYKFRIREPLIDQGGAYYYSVLLFGTEKGTHQGRY